MYEPGAYIVAVAAAAAEPSRAAAAAEPLHVPRVRTRLSPTAYGLIASLRELPLHA